MPSSKLSQLAETLIGSEIVKLGADIKAKMTVGNKIYNFTIGDFDSSIFPIPKEFENDLSTIQPMLYIKKAGVRMGAIIRNELIPHHELAISCIINDNIPVTEADEAAALQYLRKQEIKIDTPLKGWTLICYCKLPLGWIKILPGRVNNYYPKEWRILNR